MSVQRISFEITNACNLNCFHCLRDDSAQKSYLKIEYLEKVLVQAKRYGTSTFILTGGEPMLHPQIEEMIDLIVRHGYSWYIVTNGTLTDRIARLVSHPDRRARLLMMSVSLDGATAESNDFVRGDGSFRKLMKTVAFLRSKGIPLCFKTSVNTANVGEMEEIVSLVSKLGGNILEFSQMHPTPELIKRNLILPRSRWADVDREFARLRGMFRISVSMCAGSRCSLSFVQCNALNMHDMHFDFDGNLSACCVLPNYRGQGDEGRKDIAGSLKDSDLWDLHSRLMGVLAGVNRAKIRKIKNNTMAESDYYPCIFCLKHFGKLEWLKELDPSNEWIADDVREVKDEAECGSEAAG